MAKAQNQKPLIRAKPDKAKSAMKSIKKGVEKTTKPKKAVKRIGAPAVAVTKPLVLAPPESPTAKQSSKQKKSLAKPTENGTSAKRKQKGLIEKPAKAPLVVLSKNSDEIKQPIDTKQKSKEKLKGKKEALESKTDLSEKGVVYEALPVEEEDFDAIVCKAKVTKVLTALKNLVEKEVATKKTSIFGDYNYNLNVSCFKIPNCPKRVYRLNLKHPIVDPTTDDVLIVVPDLKRGAKVEFETTIEHYTDLFREAGIEGLKIMPFNQLRNEYKTFESKRKLASTYDYYLCDGRIAGQIAGFCGKTFQKPRTTFHTVRFENIKNLKAEVEKSLRHTAYKQFAKGDLISIPVGSDKLSTQKIAENVIEVVKQLKAKYPGGLENIRGIDVKVNIAGTSSLPIYASTSSGPNETPNIIGPREQRMRQLKKQANEILSKFTLTKEAELLKLSKTQVERKRKFKEGRALLIADQTKTTKAGKEEVLDADVDIDIDVNVDVSVKKARKNSKVQEKNTKGNSTLKKHNES